MQATILHIENRERERMSQFGTLNNFNYRIGEPIDPNQIINNPNISLYCLNDTQKQAIFTELPANIDLASEPFCYQAQFDNAQQLIAMPYDTLHELAKKIHVDTSKFIMIHNIGRCGSTLLNKVFNEIDDGICFSELDTFSNFVTLRHGNPSELTNLLQSCMKLAFRPSIIEQNTIYGLKLRNQCVDIMDLYIKAFPEAQHLFMYRNAVDWIASLYRLFSRSGEPPPKTRTDTITAIAAYFNRKPETIEHYFNPRVASYSVIAYLAIEWSMMLDCYLELYNQGTTLHGVRYDDLDTQREKVLEGIFKYCNIPIASVEDVLQVFAHDSQEGTRLARENPNSVNTHGLSETQIEEIHTMLQQHPIIKTPDYILPGTIS